MCVKVRKCWVFLFFMSRNGDLFLSDEVAWNLTFQHQSFVEVLQYLAIVKKFAKLTKKDLCQSLFLKHPATLKEDSGASIFPWILKFLKKTFLKNAFRWLLLLLEKLLRSIQNLPLQCWYNNLKTHAKKLVLVKFQTRIGNWLFK